MQHRESQILMMISDQYTVVLKVMRIKLSKKGVKLNKFAHKMKEEVQEESQGLMPHNSLEKMKK
jgi:phosphoribosylaminoimidazole-succinocarboxamide synthase